jgi:hypothetical protein
MGGFMIAEVARHLFENKHTLPFTVYLVNSVQEEIGLRGAEMISRRLKPDVAIVTDVTHDTYSPLYNKKQARRHEVRPGVTGWAQVNGRNAISWRRKLNLDVWYVENQSFLLDLRILILTIKKVLSRSDISANNQVTVNKFTGNNKS